MPTASPLHVYAGAWAIVTGACSGIGRAYVDRLAAAGLKVLMISDNRERLEAAARQLRSAHAVEIESRCIDLSRLDFDVEIDEFLRTHDVAVLVSNASFGKGGALWQQERARLRQMVNLNVGAYLLLIHACAQTFVAKGRGAIIIVSSVNAATPVPTAAVYTATKAFEFYLGAALWDEVQGTGVEVQVVLPGPTRTNFQSVAGTKVARVAIEPEALVDLAIPHLGRGPVFVPMFNNQLAYRLTAFLPLTTRLRIAGEFYRQLLNETPEVSPARLFLRVLFQRRSVTAREGTGRLLR